MTSPPPDVSDDDVARSSATEPPARDLGALVIPGVLVVLGTLLVTGIVTMREAGDGGLFGPKAFPWLVAGLCYVVAVLMTVQILRPHPPAASADPGDEADTILDTEPPQATSSNWRSLGIVIGGVVLFIVMLEPVGWLISATLLFAIVSFGLGARNHVVGLLAGLGMASAVQLVFSGFLGIHIPPGILG
ncbi:tripartite tricarboxylate transporter TctB family protein [Epidermidibacterium keratini]|uniref:Tripartite tricarboxylate transporter TctB family protein n=1 Tax=Epidermidibacterium keratini TaxID=1891644 RepID=A0A7L4YIU3_9ACTN|nr:tripartite tricarboxylate transporter TctB family protein [Epidermidibacterium keratini]QHB99215.1 tripartite tricarboxylate transporter TctB family protein [Epidermidibacterium keratini]